MSRQPFQLCIAIGNHSQDPVHNDCFLWGADQAHMVSLHRQTGYGCNQLTKPAWLQFSAVMKSMLLMTTSPVQSAWAQHPLAVVVGQQR